MITEDKVIELFYMADEYSREFSKVRQKYSLDEGRNDGKRRRNKPNRMSDAEIMVILILFHTGGFRCFKHFYLEYVTSSTSTSNTSTATCGTCFPSSPPTAASWNWRRRWPSAWHCSSRTCFWASAPASASRTQRH